MTGWSLFSNLSGLERPKGRDGTPSSLSVAIETINPTKEASSQGRFWLCHYPPHDDHGMFYDRTFHIHVLPGFGVQQTGLR